jgi:hypothetical protein
MRSVAADVGQWNGRNFMLAQAAPRGKHTWVRSKVAHQSCKLAPHLSLKLTRGPRSPSWQRPGIPELSPSNLAAQASALH